MQRVSRRLRFFGLALLGVCGCVSETTNGNTTTFSYELWVPSVVMLIGIVAAPAGWIFRKSIPRLGWSLLILAPIALIALGPSLFLERSTLDDKSFTVHSGVWGMTANHSVNFDDLRQVRIIVEHSTGRRGRKQTNFFLMCERKDGTVAKIAANNQVTEAAAVSFLKKLQEREIPVVDQTN